MPNWCNNELTVTGPAPDLQRFTEKANGHSPWREDDGIPNPLNFHSLVPIPEKILEAGYAQVGYNWEKQYWGCKWGACATQVSRETDTAILFCFDTAWTPPLEFLATVARNWPTLTFNLKYEETGIGFSGQATATGEKMEDCCIEK